MKKVGIVLFIIVVITVVISLIAYSGITGNYPFDSEDKGVSYYNTIMLIKSLFVIGNLIIVTMTAAILLRSRL